MAAKRADETRTFTVRFTTDERALIDKLLKARTKELFEATGQHIEVSVAAYLRWLIEKDAKERGIAKTPAAAPTRRK